MEKRTYRRPTVKVVSLVTKEGLGQLKCRSKRETNPIGPCNNDIQADCETTVADQSKCEEAHPQAS